MTSTEPQQQPERTTTDDPPSKPVGVDDGGHTTLHPLPTLVRVGLYFLGWLLVLIGIVGLAVPGIQGLLTLALGAAVLSLASEAAHRRLRRVLRRWPRGQRLMERFRSKLHGLLSRRKS